MNNNFFQNSGSNSGSLGITTNAKLPTANTSFNSKLNSLGIKANVKDPSTWISILLIILICVLIIYFLVRLGLDYQSFNNNSPALIDGTRIANQPKIIKGNQILPSYDKQYGIEFSYAFWIYIEGSTFNNESKYKHVFHKGNSSSVPLQSPGVWLYPSENTMAIIMNSTNSIKNSCNIGNLPMNKWVHVCISVIGKTLDVYVNAKLRKRCKIDGIPKQNYGDLYITKWGGFDGFLSQFRYYSYALPFYRLEQIFKDGPSSAPCTETGVTPPYLAPDYWMTTGFPNTQVSV